MKMKGPIAVLMGGGSSEREISLRSGSAVLTALLRKGYDAVAVDPADGLEGLLRGGFERVFIALHGRHGEDGALQGLLEMMGLPYTGSGVLASAATMDKAFAKTLMAAREIPTPPWQLFEGPQAWKGHGLALDYPVIIKPAAEGSTLGVVRVTAPGALEGAMAEAFRYGGKVLAERFIAGREVTVAVLDGTVFPIVEVVPKSGFYDFQSKYTKGMTRYIVPAPLDGALAARISETALAVYNLFGCRGAARVDIMIEGESPFVLEINTVPGMTETSLLPMAAAEAGLPFDDLVERILLGAALDGAAAERGEAPLRALKGCA